ncbi:MAG: hypothetical protein ACOH19_03200 [Rhodoglobus sp.]
MRQPQITDLVPLQTSIHRQQDAALDALVVVTGVSKASLVRRALAELLAANGALPPETADQITPTRSTGQLASTKRKKEAQ